jgi:SAM-dependent methyltransferase
VNANDRNPPPDNSAVGRRAPELRYNRLLDAAGIEVAIQLKLDAVRYRIAERSAAAVARYGRGRALDIGAGNLGFADDFSAHFSSYTSLDYEVRSPRLAVQGDGQSLPFRAQSFDTIISIDVLEHVLHPWQMLAEIKRVLAPQGYAILVTPFFFWAHEEPADFFRLSKYGLARLCQELGLQVIVLEPTCGFVASLGLLGTVAITRALHHWPAVPRPVLLASRAFQHSVCLYVDDRVDRSRRFAQRHLMVAQNA